MPVTWQHRALILLVPLLEDINLPRVTSPQHELCLLIIPFILHYIFQKSRERAAVRVDEWKQHRGTDLQCRRGVGGGSRGTAWSKSRSMWLMTIKWKCSVAEMLQIVTLPRGCWLRNRVAGAVAWPTAPSLWTWLLCLLCRTGAFYVHYAEQGLGVCITPAAAAAVAVVVVVVVVEFDVPLHNAAFNILKVLEVVQSVLYALSARLVLLSVSLRRPVAPGWPGGSN